MNFLSAISSGAVGGLLGGVGELAKDIRQAITGDLPAEKQAEIIANLQKLENEAMQAQTLINLEESKSERIFVSGWRPFVGWICGFALAYVAVLEPFMTWVARLYGSAAEFPTIDTTVTMQVLIGMLGLGAYRSYDKKNNPTGKGGV